jgi:hypothetical protein
MARARLSGRVGAALDPCAAIQVTVDLADAQEKEVVFILGAAGTDDEARQFAQRFRTTNGAREALQRVWNYWNSTLGIVYVETPDPAVNVLANGWLLYQDLSCRMWGRTGFYQSGGAYGFCEASWTGGYCMIDCGSTSCPSGSGCVEFTDSSYGCLDTCTASTECRSGEGYVCATVGSSSYCAPQQ